MKWAMGMMAAMALLFGAVQPQTASASPLDYALMTGKRFGTIDLTNGDFTYIGSSNLGLQEMVNLTRLGGGPLYATTDFTTMLILNESSGAVSSIVGTMGNGIFGLKISGSGAFFGYNNTDLYSINPANANATFIGGFGISIGTNYDVAFNGNQMYLEEVNGLGGTANLYTVNTTTAAATLVGNVGYAVYGLDFENNTLYGFTPNGQIISIDTTTGSGTFVAIESGPGVVFTAATAATPEPDTLFLLAVGVVGAAGATWRRRRVL